MPKVIRYTWSTCPKCGDLIYTLEKGPAAKDVARHQCTS